ncbi:hypothetical protein C7821_12078 [Streptomyces sp. VMFN-G11Ma]|nr:hypothetical protein C7821_12078 [Streptomyces sp. VMFN-G11Ma]
MQIFIRCPRHLWDDVKFGQIGGAGILAGDARTGIQIRLWTAGVGTHNPVMPKTEAFLPLTTATTPVRSQQQPGPRRRPTLPTS